MAEKQVANSTNVLPEENAVTTVHQIYYDNSLLEEIIKNIHPLERLNVELTSKRFRELSVRTACFKEPHLEMEMDLSKDKNNLGVHLKIRREVDNDYAFITTAIKRGNSPEEMLETYRRIFKNSVRCVISMGVLDDTFLQLIEAYLPNVTTLKCGGFSKEAITYVNSGDRKISKQIKKFCFQHFYKSGDVFKLFKNLVEIEIGQLCKSIVESLEAFQGKLDCIYCIEFPSKEFGLQLSQKCHRLMFNISISNTYDLIDKPFLDFENLYCLKPSFCCDPSIIRSFFKDCNLEKVEQMVLTDLYYTRATLRLIDSKLSAAKSLSYLYLINAEFWPYPDGDADCVLTEEELDEEITEETEFLMNCESDGDDYDELWEEDYPRSVCRILPVSLKKLFFFDTVLNPMDIRIIAMRGYNLEVLGISYLEHDKDEYCSDYSKILKSLTKLKKFLTNVYVDTNVIKTILDPSCKLRYIEFNFKRPSLLKSLIQKANEEVVMNYNKSSEVGKYSLMFPGRFDGSDYLEV